MCSQYTAHSESPASAADSFTYTDTHPQASYHKIPTHRYISVIYYVTSVKICDSWHSHPLHGLWYRHTKTPLLLRIHQCWRERSRCKYSHQNSHDAHQKCQMTSCFCVFSYGITDNRGVGDFRRHVKIQQLVVLCRCFFGCFMNPLAKQSHIRCFSEGTVLGPRCGDCCCPHENSLLKSHYELPYAGFWSIITDSSAQDEFIFTSIQKHDPPKDSLFSFQCQNILYFSIISIRNTFPLSPCSFVQTNTMNTKLLYFLKHKLHLQLLLIYTFLPR